MRNTHAHTLVEALISISILAVILLGLYGVLLTGNAVVMKDGALLEVQQQTRNGMDRMAREIRGASTHTITVNDADSDTIQFTTVTLTNARYYRSGTNLVREYPSGTTKVVATHIAHLKFTFSGKTLNISIRADKTNYARTISFSLSENVRLRNE